MPGSWRRSAVGRYRFARAVPVRRGLVVAAATAIATFLGSIGTREGWQGVWQETQGQVGVGLVIVVPVVVAAGAWVAATSQRDGLTLLTHGSSRPKFVARSRDVLEAGAWVAIGWLVGLAPAYAMTAVVPHSGHPGLLRPAAQVAFLLAALASGRSIGARLGPMIGPPVLAVGAYLVLGLLSFKAETVLYAVTPLDDRSYTFFTIVPWVLWIQVVGWLAVIVAFLSREAGARRTAWAFGIAAGLVAAPALYAGSTDRVPDPHADRLVCSAGGPRIRALCVPRAKAYLVPAIRSTLERALLVGKGLVPDRPAVIDYEAMGGSPRATASVQTAEARFEAGGQTLLRMPDLSATARLNDHQFLYDLAWRLVPASEAGVTSVDLLPAGTPVDVVRRWLLEAWGVPIDGTAAPGAMDLRALDLSGHETQARWFDDLEAGSRARWFAAHRDEISAGRLAWDDFR